MDMRGPLRAGLARPKEQPVSLQAQGSSQRRAYVARTALGTLNGGKLGWASHLEGVCGVGAFWVRGGEELDRLLQGW